MCHTSEGQTHPDTFLSTIKSFPGARVRIQVPPTRTTLALYLGSTFAVASSMINIRFFFRIALARHTNCLCPTLKFDPDSANSVSILPGRSSMASLSCTYRCRQKKGMFINKLLNKSLQLQNSAVLLPRTLTMMTFTTDERCLLVLGHELAPVVPVNTSLVKYSKSENIPSQ